MSKTGGLVCCRSRRLLLSHPSKCRPKNSFLWFNISVYIHIFMHDEHQANRPIHSFKKSLSLNELLIFILWLSENLDRWREICFPHWNNFVNYFFCRSISYFELEIKLLHVWWVCYSWYMFNAFLLHIHPNFVSCIRHLNFYWLVHLQFQ